MDWKGGFGHMLSSLAGFSHPWNGAIFEGLVMFLALFSLRFRATILDTAILLGDVPVMCSDRAIPYEFTVSSTVDVVKMHRLFLCGCSVGDLDGLCGCYTAAFTVLRLKQTSHDGSACVL